MVISPLKRPFPCVQLLAVHPPVTALNTVTHERWCRLRDKNSDGKLNWEEFHSGAYEQIRDHSSEELQSGYNHIQPSADDEAKKQVHSKEMFATLDLNKDG